MATYYFDLLECGVVTRDEEGCACDSLANAKTRAIDAARAVMCAEIATGQLCLSCCIEVRDAGGDVVYRVPFFEAVQVSGLPERDRLNS